MNGYTVQQARLAAALGIVTDQMYDADGAIPFPAIGLARVVAEDELSDADLVLGLVELATILLVKLEKTGLPMDGVLRDIALRYLRR